MASVDCGSRSDSKCVTTSSGYDTGSSNWTNCVWVRSTDSGSSGVNQTVIFQSAGSGTRIGMLKELYATTTTAVVQLGTSGFPSGSTALTEDNWYFLSVHYNGSNYSIRVNAGSKEVDVAGTPSADGGYTLGYFDNSGTPIQQLAGQMAHFHSYSADLTVAELQEVMIKPGRYVKNLETYLPMLGVSTLKLLDRSGSANNGTATGSPTQSDLGPPV